MARDKISMDEIKSVLAERGFVFERMLGRGTFGSVVAATQLLKGEPGKSRLLRRYAVKLMKDDSNQPRQLKYQERELELLTEEELLHPNVIRYYSFWQHQQILAIRMGCCGSNLVHVLFKDPKVIEAIKQGRFYQHVFPQILSGLSVIHSLGWVHRDIHPWNILVVDKNPQQVENMVIKIADFGLARRIGPMTTNLSARQELDDVSSLENGLFRAPEISTRKYDHKVDLYSAGIVLYTLSGHSERPDLWKKNITELRYYATRKPGELAGHLGLKDEILLNLFVKLLHSEPEGRPSANECRESLLKSLGTRTFSDVGSIHSNEQSTPQDIEEPMDCSSSSV